MLIQFNIDFCGFLIFTKYFLCLPVCLKYQGENNIAVIQKRKPMFVSNPFV